MSYLLRLVDQRIEERLQSTPVLIIDGPRACGKTTTAERFCGSTIRLI